MDATYRAACRLDRRLWTSVRRIFFAFPSRWRRRLWDERLRLGNANCHLIDGVPSYGPLTEKQRRQLARVNRILGSVQPTLFGLGFHQAFERAVYKTIDKIKGER